jgi:hypothetical protein
LALEWGVVPLDSQLGISVHLRTECLASALFGYLVTCPAILRLAYDDSVMTISMKTEVLIISSVTTKLTGCY